MEVTFSGAGGWEFGVRTDRRRVQSAGPTRDKPGRPQSRVKTRFPFKGHYVTRELAWIGGPWLERPRLHSFVATRQREVGHRFANGKEVGNGQLWAEAGVFRELHHLIN